MVLHPDSAGEPPRVNFVIVGAQKSGTTALAQFLVAHPQVCLGDRKELHFFDREAHFVDDRPAVAGYHVHFSHWSGEPVVGEATPVYMYLPHVARRMREYNPHLRLIVLLRDPAERAWSHYHMARRRGRERRSFLLALLLERWRLARDRSPRAPGSATRWHSYLDRGRYARQIGNLLLHFPRDQLLVLRAEELRERHGPTLHRVYDFLGIDAVEPPPADTVFSGGPPPVPGWVRRWVRVALRSQLRELQTMMGWERPGWGG